MSLNFSEPKVLSNLDNVEKISVKTSEGKPARIITEKCDSFGVKKSDKYNTKTLSVVLDENSRKRLENIMETCEKQLGKSLSKILYERVDGSVVIYPKIRDYEEYKSVFYDVDGEEMDAMKFEGKHFELKCVLEVEGILVGEDKASLQLRVYEAIVRKKVYEHKRILGVKW